MESVGCGVLPGIVRCLVDRCRHSQPCAQFPERRKPPDYLARCNRPVVACASAESVRQRNRELLFRPRPVAAAAAVIHERRPDIVTLNEVCRGDVSELKQAMSDSHRSTFVASAFKAAPDRAPNGPFRCRNGQQYGIGALALTPSSESGYGTYGGVYPIQDLATLKNGWLCIHVANEVYACTTHAASTSTDVAFAQCRYLLESAAPTMRSQGGADPAILGADLNLLAGRSPDPESCLPRGYQRADDGSRQDIVVSPGIALRSPTIIDGRPITRVVCRARPATLADALLIGARRSRNPNEFTAVALLRPLGTADLPGASAARPATGPPNSIARYSPTSARDLRHGRALARSAADTRVRVQ